MRVEPAPILVVTLVSLVGPLREVEVVPVAGGLIRLHAAAADLRRQQAAECERMVADDLGVESIPRLAREESIRRIELDERRARHRALPVSRGGHE